MMLVDEDVARRTIIFGRGIDCGGIEELMRYLMIKLETTINYEVSEEKIISPQKEDETKGLKLTGKIGNEGVISMPFLEDGSKISGLRFTREYERYDNPSAFKEKEIWGEIRKVVENYFK